MCLNTAPQPNFLFHSLFAPLSSSLLYISVHPPDLAISKRARAKWTNLFFLAPVGFGFIVGWNLTESSVYANRTARDIAPISFPDFSGRSPHASSFFKKRNFTKKRGKCPYTSLRFFSFLHHRHIPPPPLLPCFLALGLFAPPPPPVCSIYFLLASALKVEYMVYMGRRRRLGKGGGGDGWEIVSRIPRAIEPPSCRNYISPQHADVNAEYVRRCYGNMCKPSS